MNDSLSSDTPMFNINDVNFTSKISDIFETDRTFSYNYDNNQYENVSDMQSFNQNIFSNLHKLFKDEHERIFNDFSINSDITDITEKIKTELKSVEINYDSKKFLEECEEENIINNSILKKQLNKEIKINFDSFKTDIHNLRNYYSKLNIDTFNLENEIINILNKYNTYYSKIKSIYSNLDEFDNIDNHIEIIDKEICDYMTDYFKNQKLNEKLDLYTINIKNIKFLKSYLNEINSINFVPFCPICMTKIVDSVIIPCGHTACQECLNKCEMKCYICRQDVTNINKLFIN
jgi:hypothetical protein